MFLYERAATRPDRENLADVRRGEFEGIRDEIGKTPQRTPDFGPSAVHPTAGAVAIGARPFLVAYNVYLGPASNMPVAKEVAKAVRGSSGGLRYVKAMGFEVDGQAQVSMNLVDTEKTPLHRAFDMVKMEAEAHGVSPTWSEIVGLVPERALFEAAARHIQLRDFSPDLVLERKVRAAITGGESLSGFVGSVASPSPTPGGGSVAAHAGALGAALAQMVAGLTMGKKKYAAVDAEMREIAVRAAALGNTLSALVARDAAAYAIVAAAYKLPGDTEAQQAGKGARSTTRCSARPRCRSRPRAPAPTSPRSRWPLPSAETRTPRATPASPRCSPRPAALVRATTCASTCRRSPTSRAALRWPRRSRLSSRERGSWFARPLRSWRSRSKLRLP